jgi:exonuclease SbcC
MIPLHISLSGFLSYRDPAELDFTTFELACISGANGAGKSSLLDAITWVLFGQARKRDDSLIHSNADAAEVAFTFAYEGNIYRVKRAVQRGKTSLLEFNIGTQGGDTAVRTVPASWRALTERTLRDTQTLIDRTLRMDYETFVNASFFLQGKADQFTQQRPSDRKRILRSILGLEIWDTYRQRAGEKRRSVEEQITAVDALLEEIRHELGEEAARRTRLGQLEAELDRLSKARLAQEAVLDQIKKIAASLEEQRKLAAALRRQAESTARQLAELDTRAVQLRSEKDVHAQTLAHDEAIRAAYKAWEQARADLEYWDEIASQFREHEKRRQPALDEINAIRAGLVQQQQNLLAQRRTVESQQVTLAEVQQQIERISAESAAISEKLAGRQDLDVRLQTARQAQADARAENPRLKSEMDALKRRIDQLQEVEGAACPVCGKPLNSTERQSLIDELSEEGRKMGDRFRANLAYLRESEQQVLELEAQIQELVRLETSLRTLDQALARHKAQCQQIEQQIALWEQDGIPRLAEIEKSLLDESYAPQARQLLAEVDAELKAIGYDAAAHDSARRAESSGRTSGSQLRALEIAQTALAALDREIAEIVRQSTGLKDELARQLSESDQAAAALGAAEAQAPDLAAAQRELFTFQEQEQQVRMEVGAARQRVLVLDDQKKREKAYAAQREEAARRVGQYKQLERAFGNDGVPALLIEQALPQIETKANEILDRLSAGSMSVHFATQSAYKDRRREDLKETLDIQISDGAGMRDYEMFSGGEAFRVNFAIRLALSEVLAQRAGARLQTLVIDEGFGSQDAQGRQRLIEAINLVRQDFAKILVITHIDELKDAFPTRIEIEKTPRGSIIRVN